MRTYKHLSNYLKRKLNKARFLINIKFRNLSLRDKARLVIVLMGLNAGILFTDYQELAKLFDKRVVYIEIADAGVVSQDNYATEVSAYGISEVKADDWGSNPPAKDTLEQMIANTFPEEPAVALALAKAESGLDSTTESWTDRMQDGRPFSVGLYQINLSVHSIGSVDCYKAFRGRNYKAVVVDEALYEKCVEMAKDTHTNLIKARQIYNSRGSNFLAWGAFANGAYAKFLTIE